MWMATVLRKCSLHSPAYYWSGAPKSGTAYTYFGSPTGLVATQPGTVTNSVGICAIAGAGEANRDGFADIISGSCKLISDNGTTVLNSTPFVFQDSATLYFGGPTATGVPVSTPIKIPADLVDNDGAAVQ